MTQQKAVWTSSCGLCKNFSWESGPTWLQVWPLHQSSHDPHWCFSLWKPSCMFYLKFWNNTEKQRRRQAATHATLDTPSAVFNWRSAPQFKLLQLCRACILKGRQMKRVLSSYSVTYWTMVRDPVHAVRSPRHRVRFCLLKAVTPWVVHSEDRGRLISCYTCTHILDFCEIIFGFLVTPPALHLVQTVHLASKTQEKHAKISTIPLQRHQECVTIQRG